MNFFQNMSIKSKLTVIILSVTLLSIIFGFTFNIFREYASLKEKIVNESMMNAKLVAEYCIIPLEFGYPDEAKANLSKLETISAIFNGCVYDIHGNLFASYSRSEVITAPPIPEDDTYSMFDGDWVHVFRTIKFNEEIKGTIYLRVSTVELSEDLNNHLISMVFIGVGMMIIAYFLAVGMQRLISQPILTLADLTERISKEADYSISIRKKGSDEIGTLYDNFNNMLEQIEKRDMSIRESKDRLQAILDNATIVVYLKDIEGRYILVNRLFEQLFHVSRESVVDKTDFDIFPADIASRFCINDQKVIKQNIPIEFEEEVLQDDGVHTYISIKFTLKGIDGKPYALCGISTDITERKQTQKALQRAHDELEQRVKERTRDLEAAQKELIKSERLAVLGRLIASVSHELRNPLGVIRSSIFYLNKKLKKKDQKTIKHINRIDEQIEQCNSIIEDLMEFSRGSKSIVFPRDLNSFLNEVTYRIISDEQSDISLDSKLSSELPFALFDEEKMRIVLENIFKNASYAIQEKKERLIEKGVKYKPIIQLTTSKSETGIKIEIEDNGIGMDTETQNQAFDPLFTTETQGSIGLGLAIVEKIIEEHNGIISIQSEPNKGTKVCFVIPMKPCT